MKIKKHGNTKPFEWDVNENGCFIINSHSKNKDGYASTFRNRKFIRIHRLIYEECFGEIPKGKVILHKCDNPSCINPEHLLAGTQKENIHDMIKKGRQKFVEKYCGPKGRDVWCNKLKEEDVLKIRNDNRSQAQISEEYGISRGYVSRVRNKQVWGWLQ